MLFVFTFEIHTSWLFRFDRWEDSNAEDHSWITKDSTKLEDTFIHVGISGTIASKDTFSVFGVSGVITNPKDTFVITKKRVTINVILFDHVCSLVLF